jgi:hypothetical protein
MNESHYHPEPTTATSPAILRRRYGLALLALLLIGFVVVAGLTIIWLLYGPKPVTDNTTITPHTDSGIAPSPNTGPGSAAVSNEPAAPTPKNCTSSDVGLNLGSTEGAAGTNYLHLVLANKSNGSCTLAGYPTVFLVDGSNNTLGSGASPQPATTPGTITLAPSAKAHVVAGFPQPGNFPSGTCTASSASIRLYLPGATSYIDTTLAKPYCPGFSVTALSAGE